MHLPFKFSYYREVRHRPYNAVEPTYRAVQVPYSAVSIVQTVVGALWMREGRTYEKQPKTTTNIRNSSLWLAGVSGWSDVYVMQKENTHTLFDTLLVFSADTHSGRQTWGLVVAAQRALPVFRICVLRACGGTSTMNEWTNKWTNGWMKARMNEWMYEEAH